MMPSTATRRRISRHRPDLFLRHLPEGFPVPPHRCAENHEILNRSADRHPDDDPERAGKKSELRGERWSYERPGPRNRGEVVTENDPPVGRHEVSAVIEPHRRRGASGIERENAAGYEPAVKPVRHRVRAKRRDQQPRGIHRLAM